MLLTILDLNEDKFRTWLRRNICLVLCEAIRSLHAVSGVRDHGQRDMFKGSPIASRCVASECILICWALFFNGDRVCKVLAPPALPVIVSTKQYLRFHSVFLTRYARIFVAGHAVCFRLGWLRPAMIRGRCVEISDPSIVCRKPTPRRIISALAHL